MTGKGGGKQNNFFSSQGIFAPRLPGRESMNHAMSSGPPSTHGGASIRGDQGGTKDKQIVRKKLDKLCQGLEREGDLTVTKVWKALSQAVQNTSKSTGGTHGPNFEREFSDCLAEHLPHAHTIHVSQDGGHSSQWKVTIDGGRPMFCSVRMDVLSDNQEFVEEIKKKANIVRETLLKDGGKWQKTLSGQISMGRNSRDSASKFFQELQRIDQAPERERSGGGGGGGGGRGARAGQWVEAVEKCKVCGMPMHTNLLGGVHHCVVNARFQCQECNVAWVTGQGRVIPGDRTLIKQKCRNCQVWGTCQTWEPIPPEEQAVRRQESYRGERRGMHQTELCGACEMYGNCQGVFYEPYILTQALNLVSSDDDIHWEPDSVRGNDMFVAQCRGIELCLQPHIYLSKQGATQSSMSRSSQDQPSAAPVERPPERPPPRAKAVPPTAVRPKMVAREMPAPSLTPESQPQPAPRSRSAGPGSNPQPPQHQGSVAKPSLGIRDQVGLETWLNSELGRNEQSPSGQAPPPGFGYSPSHRRDPRTAHRSPSVHSAADAGAGPQVVHNLSEQSAPQRPRRTSASPSDGDSRSNSAERSDLSRHSPPPSASVPAPTPVAPSAATSVPGSVSNHPRFLEIEEFMSPMPSANVSRLNSDDGVHRKASNKISRRNTEMEETIVTRPTNYLESLPNSRKLHLFGLIQDFEKVRKGTMQEKHVIDSLAEDLLARYHGDFQQVVKHCEDESAKFAREKRVAPS